MMSLVPKSVFISGCSRGIGLEFVKQFLSLPNPPKHIFATCRNLEKAQELNDLASKNPSVHTKAFDILNHDSYPSVVSWVEDIVGEEGLNLLINNAAVFDVSSVDTVTKEGMISSYEANTIAPLFIARSFLPLLKKAVASGYGKKWSYSQACIINMTSRMGSIDDNTSGGRYPYRTSKAALNMVTRSLSVDLKNDGILCLVLHPGWVQTDMGGQNAPLKKEDSVSKMIAIMTTLTEQDSGCFRSFDGSNILW